ncbi:MAG: response regulator [Bacteroidetes bacterium]|nr:response regulator [Bacteroidota bacterium]
MQSTKLLIVEDEILIAEDIKDALIGFGYTSIDMAHSYNDAIKKIESFKPNIVLLDIRMQEKNDGLKIAEVIKSRYQIPHIFITSHSDIEMVKQVVNTAPAGYITKPFKKTDLFASINMALSKNEKTEKKISFKDGYKTIVIQISKINFIKSDGNYVDITYNQNQKLTCRRTLESILIELSDECFFKINKSSIINLKYVTSYNSKYVFLDKDSFAISRNYLGTFKQQLDKV